MPVVADVSPGTVPGAGSTRRRYTVAGGDDDTVVACGPRGVLRVARDELQRNIARGAIEVRE